MVKHMILWKLKDEVQDKETVKAEIKSGLEGLKGVVPGIVELVVQTHGLPSSNADLLLDSSFVDEDALKGYATHPDHVAVANERVRPYAEIRLCLDYEA